MKIIEYFKVLSKLDRIIRLLEYVIEKELQMSAELDALQVSVTNAETVEASAVTLIQGISAQLATLSAELAAAGQDTTAIDKMKNDLDTSTQALADAVTVNTPAAPVV
jgi:RIO-like serine/threonine protein kinase